MRAAIVALRLAALSLGLATLGGCKPKLLMVVSDNAPTINLFGFEESQLHHIHNTVELRRNIFLVRYDAKKPNALEWINCPIPATYTYRQANGRRVESIYIHSQQELQAKVPVNYARFAGYVKNGKALAFNYVTIGSYELLSDFKIPRNDPDCARATHYVSTLSVGAFNFAEQRQTEGKLEATENTTGVGVGVGAGRSAGELTAMGNLDACMDDQAAFLDCFTPLQVMMMPIPDRNWSADVAERVEPTPGPESGPAQQETVNTDLSLHIDAATWNAGSYMAKALQEVLVFASRIELTTNYGFDELGNTLLAGYLTGDKPLLSSRMFEAGKTYAIIGATATGSNIDLGVFDMNGNLLAADEELDATPVVQFTPPTTDAYYIGLVLAEGSEELGTVVIMQEHGGVSISSDILQGAFQRLLDAGAEVSVMVQQEGFGSGMWFNENTWAVQGTVLTSGEAIRQREIMLPGSPAVFIAVAHEPSRSIGLEVVDAQSGQTWSGGEPSSMSAVVVEEPNPASQYESVVMFQGPGGAKTLATSLILQLVQ